MSQAQLYVNSLLNDLVQSNSFAGTQAEDLEAIRQRIAGAVDLNSELRQLYSVVNFSQLSLGLMWIAEKVERNPSLLEPVPEDLTLIRSLYTNAIEKEEGGAKPAGFGGLTFDSSKTGLAQAFAGMGDAPAIPEPPAPDPNAQLFPGMDSGSVFPSMGGGGMDAFASMDGGGNAAFPSMDGGGDAAFPSMDGGTAFPSMDGATPVMPGGSDFMMDMANPLAALHPEEAASRDTTDSGGEGGSISQAFAGEFERFLVAIQGGDDNRAQMMADLIAHCGRITGDGGSTESYRQLAETLQSFLMYITQQDLLDDVRVMNILSNLSDSIVRGAQAEPANRDGFAMEAVDVLKDFKSLFE